MTLADAIVLRLSLPATPTELAATLGKPVHLMRAYCYQLRRQGRVCRLDRSLPVGSKRGRNREYLWMAE